MAASALEQAMRKRRDAADTACRRREPEATDISVAIAFGRCVVDYKDKDGDPHRFEHFDDVDEIGAVEAEASTNIRRVRHG
jgi:hypothetical protein